MSFNVLVMVVAGVILILFRTTWIFIGKCAGITISLLKWAIISGLITALWCSPQGYRALGWTPLSALLGDQVYAHYGSK